MSHHPDSDLLTELHAQVQLMNRQLQRQGEDIIWIRERLEKQEREESPTLQPKFEEQTAPNQAAEKSPPPGSSKSSTDRRSYTYSIKNQGSDTEKLDSMQRQIKLLIEKLLPKGMSQFSVNERVRIVKNGRQKGNFAIVTDPDWNGLVKVSMETGGATKSYRPFELQQHVRQQSTRQFTPEAFEETMLKARKKQQSLKRKWNRPTGSYSLPWSSNPYVLGVWASVIMICIILNWTFTLLEVTFDLNAVRLDTITEVIYIVDLLMNFVIEDPSRVVNWGSAKSQPLQQHALMYFESWFWVDALSCVPVTIIQERTHHNEVSHLL